MTDHHLILERVAAANPVPQPSDPPEGTIDVRTVAAYVSNAPAADEADREEESRLGRPDRLDNTVGLRRGVWMAAAAFIAVLAVGALFLLTRTAGNDVVEPTTTLAPTSTVAPTTESPATTAPPDVTAEPTTTEAPTVDAADQAAIDAFVAAFNAGDVETVLASLSEDALFWSFVTAGGTSEEPFRIADAPDLVSDWFVFSAQLQTQTDLSTCSPFFEGRINCSGTLTDLVVEQSPLGPAGLSVTFDVNDNGEISYLFFRTNDAAMNAAYVPFGMWHSDNYPDEAAAGSLFNNTGRARTDDAARQLWAIRVPEWLASLEG